MKTIKYSLSALLAVLLSVCVMSCGEDYSSPLKGQIVSDQTFETGTNSKTVTIGTKDLSKCTVSSSANWCSATIQTSMVVINVQPNDTYEERQAVITLTDPEDGTILSFKVVQKQNDAILIDKDNYDVPEEGGDITINVKSNVDYIVEIPSNSSWLSQKKLATRGLKDSKIVLSAEKNNSGDERQATVLITDKNSRASSSITITQSLTPFIDIEKENYSVLEDASTIEISVKTNIKLEMIIDKDWIIDAGRINNNDLSFTQKLNISPLSSNSGRTATVVLKSQNTKWDLSKEVHISQTRGLYITSRDISIYVGESYAIKYENNTDQNLKWDSSDTSIATVNSDGVVKGKKKGVAVISVSTLDGKKSDKVSVDVQKKIVYKAEAVDLGLSVLWSAYNLGAENPENVGASFAWGETAEKSSYNQNNYLYYDNNMEQYIFIGKDISGTQYDAATVNLGGKWRMPTRDEMTELLKNCSWEWMQINGMNGYKVTSNNGNSIFMPAAGGADFNQDGKYLRYYTSTQYSLGYVLTLVLDSSFFGSADFGFNQYYGFAIRPVKSK
ncbi:Putative binding domain-containing protein, N-terminal [Prevotella sp. ne3005]|uniref:BACON domain-containing protein n=1 Tax=Prevotella sp. ne3005 TaxID=1761887 RepID=UPI0008C5AB9F|nr:BACON domain-containing carbohydrate-binding protein [Prevotella sp. ne3005]SEM63467.1 Putative binding domain-containing protein, N-terminal [Prevotella sp. ne3005]